MKIKIDFITNSSSASFSIPKEKLTKEQIILIFNHIEMAKFVSKPEFFSKMDEWLIWEKDDMIHGSTSMDNFDMFDFLTRIGIAEKDIDYDSSNDY